MSKLSIDDFEIQATIGKGAFGEVVIGINKKNNKTYALKIFSKAFLSEKRKTLSVIREKEILKFLTQRPDAHENILKLYGSFQSPSEIYFQLELVEGMELESLITSSKKLELPLVQHIVKQLIGCIKYLNDNGILHGDIKPQNIMITKDYTIKLIDFGSANIFKATEANKQAFDAIERFRESNEAIEEPDNFNGTAPYASPELIESGENRWKDDIWSLGTHIMRRGGLLPDDDRSGAFQRRNPLAHLPEDRQHGAQ